MTEAAEREKLISCIMGAISEHGKLCGPEEIADAILAAGFRLVTPTSEGEVQQAARELMEAWAEICKDKLPRAVPASIVCANYILSLALGKDVVEGAKQVLRDWCSNEMLPGDYATLTRLIAAFATAHAAKERADEREACAELCLRIWKEAPNERTDSALTSYRQTAISHGCIASAAAIRARKP